VASSRRSTCRVPATPYFRPAKGNQGGIVQLQIETIELRQWLFLVSARLVERAYTEVATLRVFSVASFHQKPVKIAAPNSDLSLLGCIACGQRA
jgi:hypothetical protein